MKFQLVLQWPASSIADYDTMIEIEDALLENLADGSEVDGHDMGSGTTNIFLFTDHPQSTFAAIQNILGTRDFWVDARVAYRPIDGEDYTVLWPPGLATFDVI